MIMNTFHLQIVTPDGLMFDGDAEKLLVRTTEGDVGIMSGHCDYVTPVDTGMAKVTTNGDVRTAACSGGLLNVKKGTVRLVASTFEWSEDIDVERALRAKEAAEKKAAPKPTVPTSKTSTAAAPARRVTLSATADDFEDDEDI